MSNKKQVRWKPPRIIEKVTDDTLNYGLQQAETLLKEKLESGQRVTEKATRVLTIATSLLTGLLVYIATTKDRSELLTAALLSSGCCLTAIYYIVKALRGYYTTFSGAPPRIIFQNNYLNSLHAQKRTIYIDRLIHLQRAIDVNEAINRARNYFNDVAIIMLSTIPFTLPLSFLFFYILNKLF